MANIKCLSRRNWLKLSLCAAGISASGSSLAWLYRDRIKTLQADDVESFLRGNFDYLRLNVSSEEFAKFHEGYNEFHGKIPRPIWHRARGGDERVLKDALDNLAVTFLLSTSFFLNRADETKEVRYVTFYSPYVTPCYDPVGIGNRTPQ